MWLGRLDLFLVRLLSIGAHEICHILAGLLLIGKLPREFSIMPWGFFLKLDMEFSPPWKRIVILIAGPLSNLLLWIFFTLHGWEEYGEMNLSLCLFNLLPVSPLDGGLIAAATGLHSRLPGTLSHLQGAISALFGGIVMLSGVINISRGLRFLIPVLCGAAILTPHKDKGDMILMSMSQHIKKRKKLRENSFLEIRAVAVNENTTIGKIAEHMPCDRYNIYCVMMGDMTPCGFVDEGRLLDAMLSGRMDHPVSEIIGPLPALSSQGHRAQVRGSVSLR